MSHPSSDPLSIPQDFSDLEVVLRRTDEGLKEVRVLSNDELKEVYNSSHASENYYKGSPLSVNSPPSALSSTASFARSLPDKEGPAVGEQRAKRICGLPAKGFWLLLALTLVAATIAVGVPVGLYIHKMNASPPSSTGPSLAIASGPSPGSTAPTSPAPAPPAFKDASSGIASVAWNDTNGVAQYRVYYQDDKLAIQESAWNASSNKWQETGSIGTAKNQTPIAAVVAGPQDFTFGLCVFAVGGNGTIIEWTSRDAKTFKSGYMASQNRIPANVSSLTALWDRHHGCPQCGNTLLFAYERTDGQLEVGNYTQKGWDWTTLQSNPAPGTGLALALRWQSTTSGDIRLFYQTRDGRLVSQDYNGPATPPAFTWLSREAEPIAQLTSISPLTSLTWGTTNSGSALYNDMISANASGLAVNAWDGVYNTNGPETIPSALASVDAVALASNEDKHIFALQGNGTIAVFEMLEDQYHWGYVGDVNAG